MARPSRIPDRRDVSTAGLPRGLTAEGAAHYAGCRSVSAFQNWVRKGIMPKPMPGTRRYDRRAIDAALDHLSGLSSTTISGSPGSVSGDGERNEWDEGLHGGDKT
jgi:hypothetical protein